MLHKIHRCECILKSRPKKDVELRSFKASVSESICKDGVISDTESVRVFQCHIWCLISTWDKL